MRADERSRLLPFVAARRAAITAASLALLTLIPASSVLAQTPSFGKSTLSLSGIGAALTNPTSLQFGPDGLLYVAQQDGIIKSYSIVRNAANNYTAKLEDTITEIWSIPNHNDDGTLADAQCSAPATNLGDACVNDVDCDSSTGSNDGVCGVIGRQVTGILVVGTPANPVIYVTSSDPRMGGGEGLINTNLDTNSGMLSRLTWNGVSWDKLDLVRGLPRSEENHASNGMHLDVSENILYIAQGGNTNQGAPSLLLVNLPEYALSAAILSVNLNMIGETTYDLPTLDDEERAGDPDENDPFGGNDGKNQAILVPNGPVQVYSSGWRNPYDLVGVAQGATDPLYTIDNGPNGGWGDIPENEGPAGNCTNAIQEPGFFTEDNLHYIDGPGYYGGHPNPTRANAANTFNAGNPQSPMPACTTNADCDFGTCDTGLNRCELPVECDYRESGVEDGALATFLYSTNGLHQYQATNFNSALEGDLIAASFGNLIVRIKLNMTGDGVMFTENLFTNVGGIPLDVTARGDAESFPGTIWVADWAADDIEVFEPNDIATCTVDAQCDDGLYCNGAETCVGGLCAPGADPCPSFACDEAGDTCTSTPDGDALRGGLLYDKWWVINGASAPTGDHPLYPAGGAQSGSTTYRCKECHGWDYKGVDGRYGSGSHFTDIPGVFGSTLTPIEMFDLIKNGPGTTPNGHGFGELGMSDVDIADVVQFLTDELVDVDAWIDGAGIFRRSECSAPAAKAGQTCDDNADCDSSAGAGDGVCSPTPADGAVGGAGDTKFQNGNPGPACAACHLSDGTAYNFGTPEDPEWVGTIAVKNPWEFLHKTRFGQPGATMIGWLASGADENDLADIGLYAQMNLPVECTNDGHCDDGNPCTDDSCVVGFCDYKNNTDICDDGIACTEGATCAAGICGTPNNATCDDADPCTTDTCDGLLGCTYADNTAPCDDGISCTTGDICSAGACSGADSCPIDETCDFILDQCTTDDDNDGLFGSDDPCPNDPRNLCYGDVAVDGATSNEIRLYADMSTNASCSGGTNIVDCNGDTWLVDFGYTPNDTIDFPCDLPDSCAISGVPAIFGCEDASTENLFQCDRFDLPTAPELVYSFDVPNGQYLVNLLFANTFTGTDQVGERVFDVAIEGAVPAQLADFDQVAVAGGSGIAVVRSAIVDVVDGNGLQIEFIHDVIENPALKALEVLQGAPPTTCTVDGDCDDSLYCNGTEVCNAGTCEAGTAPNCDDSVGCTDDSCNEATDTCDNVANDANCDNGLFCDGAETCGAALDCQVGTAPDCDDGVGCTDDSCNETTDSCDNVANDANCDNGLFCDGAETCDALSDCQAGIAPNCDDGVGCTDDSCDEGTDSCDNIANDANCDNGLFCDGAETCSATLDCEAGTNPCPGQACEEVDDMCIDCSVDADCDNTLFCDGAETCNAAGACEAGIAPTCDDGIGCTDDSCNEATDSCDHAANDANCDNGFFCDGIETCDVALDCQAGTAIDCDDGVGCTDDSCNEAADSCDNVANDASCDNGLFCDGTETCDAALDCQAGSDPCSPMQVCDEASDLCEACADVTVSGPVECFTQRTCTIDVALDPGVLPVSDVGSSLMATSSIECGATCENGPASPTGQCTTDAQFCTFNVFDTVEFGTGTIARVPIECTQEASGQQLCLSGTSLLLTDSSEAPSCGDGCVSFDCGSCLAGDCNQTGGPIDVGDPLCTVLCSIGMPSAGADCVCAADCNCLAGLEVSDPICAVRRQLDIFTPDTCANGAGGVLTYGTATADLVSEGKPVRVKLSTPRIGDNGRATYLIGLRGPGATGVGGMQLTLRSDERIGRLRIARRLGKRGFSMHVNRVSANEAVALILPPVVDGDIAAMLRGGALRVKLPDAAQVLMLVDTQLASTLGLPVVPTAIETPIDERPATGEPW